MSTITGELITPVYLNQRIVFDMMAMLQGGLSTVSRIISSESDQSKATHELGATFGLSSALASLIRVDLSAKSQKSEDKMQGFHRSEERIHTPASLFQVLRSSLAQSKTLHFDSTGYIPNVRDFVEFSASVRMNPLIQTMDTFTQLIDIMITLQSGEQKKKGSQTPDAKSLLSMKKQMSDFVHDLKTGPTFDIITETLSCGYSTVIDLEREFLNDSSMSSIVDGKFNVLGKIIRVLPDNTTSISLVRKSAVGSIPKKVLNDLLLNFSSISDTVDIDLPDLRIEIAGPVVQVLPIAIFV